MRRIAVINHKGGSGKTTATVNLAAGLAERGHGILVVDLDPQGSASTWLARPDADRSIFDTFLGTRDLGSLARPTRVDGVELVPSSPWLVTAERTLQVDLAVGITRAFQRMPERWDIILVDCPPTHGYLGLGALSGADMAIVPVEARAIALPGVASVVAEMQRIREATNPTLGLAGILAGRISRTIHARRMLERLRSDYGEALLTTVVRDSVRVPEAAEAGVPVMELDPGAAVTEDFRAAAAELEHRLGARPRLRPRVLAGLRGG